MIPEFLSFIIIVLVMELTPGPNMAHLAIISAGQGRFAGFAAVAGVSLGLIISAIIALLSISAIFEFPFFHKILTGAGVLYIFWLALSAWRGEEKISIQPQEVFYKYFTRGLITNILNPKAFLFFMIVTPKFSESAEDKIVMNIILSAFSVFVATVVHIAIVILAGTFQKYFASPKNVAITRKVNAVILFIIAIWLAVASFD